MTDEWDAGDHLRAWVKEDPDNWVSSDLFLNTGAPDEGGS